jgi:hypothetical protein
MVEVLAIAPAPNPSIEGTSNIRLRLLSAAPHVKRWASRPALASGSIRVSAINVE